MRSPMAKAVILGIVFAAVTVAVLVLAVRGAQRATCEVCITFRGATQCRTAVGANPNEAVKTATDNACAMLASGMTDTIACGATPPDRVTCDGAAGGGPGR